MLEYLQAHIPETPVRYWRDKSQRELDCVLAHGRDAVDVIECTWDPSAFDVTSLRVFRGFYPMGRNDLITPSGDPANTRRFGTLSARVFTPDGLRT